MKKRLLAFITAVALVVGMLPTAIFAEVNDAYGVRMTGVDREDGSALMLTLSIKGPSVAYDSGKASIGIKIDTTKLRLVRYGNGQAATISTTSFSGAAATGGNLDPDEYYLSTVAVMAREDTSKNVIYIAYQPTFNATATLNDYTDLMAIRLAYQEGVTADDLDISTIQLVTVDESYMLGQNNIAYISNVSDTNGLQYGINDRGAGEENLAKPEIIYPNSDVINLNGVKADATQRYVNVPASLPTAGANVTVQASAKGYYAADCADETEIATGVTYKYSVAMKDGTDLPDTVEIDEDTGVLTIKAGAPEAVVTITAAGSYTNTKGNTTTASGTFDVNLRHGDAGEKNEEDPTEPKKEEPKKANDPVKEASGVAIYEGTNLVTYTGADNYEKAIAIPASGNATANFTGKVVDQFGDDWTDQTGTSWTVEKVVGDSNEAYAGTNPTFNDGVVTVAANTEGNSVDKGTYVYTFSDGTYDAAVEITVDDTAITWPTLTNDTIIYGQTIDELTYDSDGTVDGQGTITGVTFNWTAGQTLAVATKKAEMECHYELNGVTKSSTKEYDITVNKADQEIVTAVDDEINNGVLQIAINDTVDLETAVKNATVTTLEADGAITYAVTDTEGLIQMNGSEVKGQALSSEHNNATATVVINAAGTDNYNPASRAIMVRVTLPVLAATITFDTTDPVFGQKIIATVTGADDQPNSVTADVDYEWGHIVPKEKNPTEMEFVSITTGNSTGKLTNAIGNVATVEYTPVQDDINDTLALKVITPTSVTGYGYIHSVQRVMDNAVAKAPQSVGTWTATTTKNSITVTEIEGANYAIKDAATAPAAEVENPPADLVWQESNVFSNLTPDTKYEVYVKMAETETAAASKVEMQVFTTAKITMNDTEDPDAPQGGEVKLDGAALVGEVLTANITDPVLHGDEGDTTLDILSNGGEIKWYRVTPAVEDDPETEEDETAAEIVDEIIGETGTTYTVAEADIGKYIRVVVTANPASPYGGSVQAQTIDVVINGHNITGVVVSYNAKNAITYELYAWDSNAGAYSETATYTGTAIEAEETTTADKQTQNFTIEGVSDGTYKLVIKKTIHLNYTINGVVVNGSDVDLTSESYPETVKSINLIAGDVDGNGAVNVSDSGVVTHPANFNAMDLDAVQDPKADIDGNSAINVTDEGIIAHPDNYNKQESDCVVNL